MNGDLRNYVMLRDGGCVARFVGDRLMVTRWPMLVGLPDPGPCRDTWGNLISPTALWFMHADHVKDELGMAIREDDPEQLWTMCPYHHMGSLGSGWATKTVVRVAARIYIAAANAFARRRGWPPYPEVVTG